MSPSDTTRCCILTPTGRSAVAVVAVEGASAISSVDQYFKAANSHPLADQPLKRIIYGHWGDQNGEDLVLFRRSDRSLEIHCHGGHQSSAQIIADLSNAGCIPIEASQWLADQAESPLTAAAHLALAKATTLRTAKILLDQYHGALEREIKATVSDLTLNNFSNASKRLEDLLQYAEFGAHLTKPWRVVIAGQPNVGKSSLINALVGFERAIVFDQPGTTRDIVTSTTAIDGWPVELSDTAGLHQTSDAIESAGIALAHKRLAEANLIVWVLDATALTKAENQNVWDQVLEQAIAVGVELDPAKTLIVINKSDLAQMSAKAIEQHVATCALTGEGISELLEAIALQLVPTAPPSGTAIPFTSDQCERLAASLTACRASNSAAAITELRDLLD